MSTPSRFGKYLLIEKLGSGGMAELFLAKQTGLKGFEKVVAIKRILPHLTESPEFVTMFINEAKLAALLTHQNIVQIFDLGSVELVYYIAMEYIMGKDLRTLGKEARERKLPITIGSILLIVSRICSALDYAHRKKDFSGRDLDLVHRDISPQNILVSYEGEVKLVDFGIAKAATGAQETKTGVLKGKLAYMSPEQAWGKTIDRRSDIFSLGVVLYEMITESRLFKGNDEISILEKVRSADIAPPSKMNPEVSPELEQVILKALAKEVDQRYQSASEMQMALENIISQKGYAFSSLSLAGYMQVLYQDEINRDTKRLQLVTSGSFTIQPEDKSTMIKKPAQEPAEMASPPAGLHRSGKTSVQKTRVSRLSKAIAVSFFSLAGLSLFFIALLSDLPGIVRVRQMVPALQTVHDTSRGYLEDKGLLNFARRIHSGLFALISPGSPPPVNTQPVSTPPLDPQPVVPPFREPAPPAGPSLPDPPPPAAPETQAPAAPKPEERPAPRHPAATRRPVGEIRQLFLMAKNYHSAGKYFETEKTLRQIIELDPAARAAYHLLGMTFLERRDIDGALRIFSDASILFPDDAQLHFDVGSIYFQKNAISLAIAELTESIQLAPRAPFANRARQMLRRLNIPVEEPSPAERAPFPPGPGNEFTPAPEDAPPAAPPPPALDSPSGPPSPGDE